MENRGTNRVSVADLLKPSDEKEQRSSSSGLSIQATEGLQVLSELVQLHRAPSHDRVVKAPTPERGT